MTVTYKAGDYLVVKVGNSDVQYEIIECGFNQIRIIDTLTRIESSRTIADIDELVVSGSAVIHQKNIKERKLLKSDAIDFASYPETLKQEARDRYIYVIDLLERKLPSLSAVRISPIIENIYSSNTFELLNKKPSARSVQRWVSNYIDAGHSIRGLVSGNANKGNRKAKVDLLAEPYIHSAIEHFKQLERPTIANSYDHLQTLINFDNIKIEDVAKKLKVMTQTAFIKRLEKEAPKQLMIARLGKEEANKHFKTSKLPQEITLILQRVESDHTQLDLFLVDEQENFILGRPYVTALLDYKSKSILGFYIGFEKPSYLSIARALRHAILPKSYVKELYPGVKNDYGCYGRPRVLVVDRGKDFESIALTDACLDLNIRIQRNPGKHPWYKGSIESYFKSLNNDLLNDMQGKVFPDIVDSNAYKPQKHAVITMSLFLNFFHIWLIDIYHQKKVSSGKIIPNVSWKEDLDRVPLSTMNKDALDIVLAEKASRKNSSDGIIFDYILYDSDELAKIRAETGFRKVEFKFNRENLGYIYVLDERNPRDKTYITVPALNQKYAKGLSRHQHKIILAFNRKYLDAQVDLESLAEAKMKIKQLIKDHLNSRKDNLLATTQNVSRWEGIGQQSDQSVKSSLREEPTEEEYKGVPKPSVAIKTAVKPATSEISGFDGNHNTLPDELDF
jgi:putative transposase